MAVPLRSTRRVRWIACSGSRSRPDGARRDGGRALGQRVSWKLIAEAPAEAGHCPAREPDHGRIPGRGGRPVSRGSRVLEVFPSAAIGRATNRSARSPSPMPRTFNIGIAVDRDAVPRPRALAAACGTSWRRWPWRPASSRGRPRCPDEDPECDVPGTSDRSRHPVLLMHGGPAPIDGRCQRCAASEISSDRISTITAATVARGARRRDHDVGQPRRRTRTRSARRWLRTWAVWATPSGVTSRWNMHSATGRLSHLVLVDTAPQAGGRRSMRPRSWHREAGRQRLWACVRAVQWGDRARRHVQGPDALGPAYYHKPSPLSLIRDVGRQLADEAAARGTHLRWRAPCQRLVGR